MTVQHLVGELQKQQSWRVGSFDRCRNTGATLGLASDFSGHRPGATEVMDQDGYRTTGTASGLESADVGLVRAVVK